MRFLKRVITLLITAFFILNGAFLISIALKLVSPLDISNLMNYIGNNYNVQITLGIMGVLLIIFSLLGANLSLGKMQREKTIAFSNPDGDVTVSLGAIEDFIRKVSRQINEVKELKSDVIAGKKGILITTRVILWSDINIPETTERIQRLIKSRLQEMLGLEDAITIKVHVIKIAQKEETSSKEIQPEVPFRSYDYGKK